MLDPALWLQGREVRLEDGQRRRGDKGAAGWTRQDAEPQRGALQRLGYVGVALLGHNQEAAGDVPKELPAGVQPT